MLAGAAACLALLGCVPMPGVDMSVGNETSAAVPSRQESSDNDGTVFNVYIGTHAKIVSAGSDSTLTDSTTEEPDGATTDTTTIGVQDEQPGADEAGDALADSLREHEKLSLKPYQDAGGVWHIGYGHRITEEEAEMLLARDQASAVAAARRIVGEDTWQGLDRVRRDVLSEAAFVLGPTGLAGFEYMLAAVRQGRYHDAADALRDSRWYVQAPERVETLAERLRDGRYESQE